MRTAPWLSAAVMLSVVMCSGTAAASPEARMETSLGTIVIALDADKAPATVANFIQYARKGHFNNTVFYRIVPGFVIQAGTMKADGSWQKLRKPIPLETATGLHNTRGTIAMGRDNPPDSAQAEYFINLSDANAQGLDAKPSDPPNTTGYAVFGHVTAGLEVVDAIAATPIGGGKGPFPANYPKTPVIIKKVTIGEAAPPPPPAPAPVTAPVAPAASDPPATPQ